MNNETLEDIIVDNVRRWDYYKGFGSYSDIDCILMQLFAEAIYD